MSQSNHFLPTIESIATGTPHHLLSQIDASKFVANLASSEGNQHRIEKIYRGTRINTRHLAIDLLTDEAVEFCRQHGNIEKRMQMYEEHAVPLAEEVARKAIDIAAQRRKVEEPNFSGKFEDEIRIIIFVTSTGFVAPGIDAKIIDRLGLPRNVARVPVNFMGCAAAMNGLRVACDHLRAYPRHKALLICLELSSINTVFEGSLNDIVTHSIFGDGCAAVVLGACDEDSLHGRVVIRDNFSYLIENTEDGISLGVRDNGITCQLSPQLPNYIESGVAPVINNFLAQHQLQQKNIDLWAVHPGGPRIIEKVQTALGLNDQQVSSSWEILREYGNVLSCAVLFVIERMLKQLEYSQDNSSPEKSLATNSLPLTGIAFSFSPGVGLEGLLFQKY
jgi:alpha-pyrone synthase